MNPTQLAKPKIPYSFAELRLELALQDLHKAKAELSKAEEEKQYWQEILEKHND